MRTLFLIRHAQGSLGTEDYDRLSDTGLKQAEVLGDDLQSHLSRSSDNWYLLRGDLRRHRQTAEAMVGSTAIEVDADLNEYRVDRLLAAAFDDAKRLNIQLPGASALADPKAYLDTFLALFPDVLAAWQERRLECTVNGQWQTFRARVQAAASRIEALVQAGRPVVAVTSAGVISSMVTDLLGHDLAWQRKLNVALYNASITELALDEDGQWHLQRLNSIAHFPRPELQTLA